MLKTASLDFTTAGQWQTWAFNAKKVLTGDVVGHGIWGQMHCPALLV